jgi:hypothetical protein
MVGGALLARPEVESDRGQIASYLPRGEVAGGAAEVWYDWFTGERMAGVGEVVWAPADRRYHLHARGGTMVPLGPPANRSDAAPLEWVTWRVFLPAKSGPAAIEVWSGRMVEDDGVSLAYANGARRDTQMTATWSESTLLIEATSIAGSYAGEPATRTTEIEVFGLGPEPPAAVRGAGGALLPRFDTLFDYEWGGAGWWWDAERSVLMAKGQAVSLDAAPRFAIELDALPGGIAIH